MLDYSKFNEENGRFVYYIGYWNNDKNQYPQYPLPQKGETRDITKDIEKIDFIINHERSKKVSMKGFSTCRICDELNGTSEYWITIKNNYYIVIPNGYKHYIEEHYILIDDMINQIFYFLNN